MNLRKKKQLAARTLGIGKDRIIFVESRLGEIKEAITKQDIRELVKDKAIIIKNVKGRKKINKIKSRSAGNVRVALNQRKRNYINLSRKLRKFLGEIKKSKKLDSKEIKTIRKAIRNKQFRSKAHLREYLGGVSK